MAIKQITMPHLGESVTEASISMWMVEEGDTVNKYDPIAEAVSDKVTTEIPSNYSGVVKEFLVELDIDVPIGTPILSIEAEGAEEPAAGKKLSEDTPVPESMESAAPRYSPAVLRMAQENTIDLNKVKGTGRHGRITRKDVARYVESPPAAEEVPEAKNPVQSVKQQPVREEDVVPADGIRKQIARRMTESASTIPHGWMLIEADVSNIVKLREKAKEDFKKQEGIPLSYFPFFVKAVVQALKKHPKLNASWDDGSIMYHKDLNLSIAVATDEHLFVPVIQQADQYSIKGLAKEINRLADSARNGNLKNEDLKGGTFTVNNTGAFGSIQSMGIINPPQAAILQVESIQKRIVPTADGGFKACDMVNLCLSIDHRVLDGLQAGRFLQEVKENLTKFGQESDLY